MHKKITFLSILLAAFLMGTFSNAAKRISWQKIIGASVGKLNAAQKETAAGLLGSIQNTRGCSGTIAECLAKDDLTAKRHAGYIVRMVRKNKTAGAIKKGIEKRALSAFAEELFAIDTSQTPYSGNPDGKIVLVEYACFECPFCAHLAPKLKKLQVRFKNNIVHYYKFFPVRSHKRGVAAALAGLAAQKQGKFWPMYDLMYANRTKLQDADLLGYAKKAGLNIEQFKKDLKDTSLMRLIEKDKLEGMRFGVEGTPTFFINGKLYHGSADYDELVDRIEIELEILSGKIK